MNRLLRPLLLLLFVAGLASCGLFRSKHHQEADPRTPIKREFRAAWLPTIFRSDYARLSREQARQLLTNRLDLLQRMGCNAVIFQVRAEGDAFYPSTIEPWSKYLTGTQGVPPAESWDPLGFVIDACHERGMELHAWINPYRGASNADAPLAANHPAKRFPQLFVRYGKQLMMDPGNPQSIAYINSVVKDIIQRYDIDAIHFDDYFYPYPKDGLEFNDQATFERFGLPAGYTPGQKARWRRENVNQLIYTIRQTILDAKPWVRFGISPFGIYRNQSSWEQGSKTKGLQSYDDLSADVLFWAREGWIDYLIPQLYWNQGFQIADYSELISWWGKHLPKSKKATTKLYAGQHVIRTMDAHQLEAKLAQSRAYTSGNAWWSGEDLVKNYGGIGDSLIRLFQSHRALAPEYQGALGVSTPPDAIPLLLEDRNEDGHMILWDDLHEENDAEGAFYYAVYAFPEGVKPQIKHAKYLVSISTKPYYLLPALPRGMKYTYVVTAINRFWQESDPKLIKINF